MRKFRAAICQNKPFRDKAKSLADASEMIREAAGEGAELAVLPEMFPHPYEMRAIPKIAEDDHRSLDVLRELARDLKTHLCSGTMAERDGGRLFNKSYLLGPDGSVLNEYSKCHMFDVSFKDLRVRESAVFERGGGLSVAKTPLAVFGVLVCFDIRFPEAARKLALMGAEMLLVPAAFNNVTGPAHWDIVFRGRAIENQVYIAAASPARDNSSAYKAYGHSMFVDPWGDVLSKASFGKKIIYADIDPERLSEVRSRMPPLKLRRPEIY